MRLMLNAGPICDTQRSVNKAAYAACGAIQVKLAITLTVNDVDLSSSKFKSEYADRRIGVSGSARRNNESVVTSRVSRRKKRHVFHVVQQHSLVQNLRWPA